MKTTVIIMFIAAVLSSCGDKEIYPDSKVKESAITVIPLSRPLSENRSEISGLDWYGDQLIFLPQYPDRFRTSAYGNLYRLSKTEIIDFLDNVNKDKLDPRPVSLTAPGIEEKIDGFQGFEAIGFDGDTVFVTVEAQTDTMSGYLLRGVIDPLEWTVTLNTGKITAIPMKKQLRNASYETLVLVPGKVIVIYEGNGRNVNPHPRAEIFDRGLNYLGEAAFPNIEYRVTDATQIAPDGTFWVSNYFWISDEDIYQPAPDQLAAKYGLAPSHLKYKHEERLIKLSFKDNSIEFAPAPPLQIQLISNNYQRNWEGIVRLDDKGFLLVTDKFPETIFGFVAFPADSLN
jgi:hypothetical protein